MTSEAQHTEAQHTETPHTETQHSTGREPEHDEPNEYGFAGGATTPTPEPGRSEGFGEAIAVPAGDITGSLMHALDGIGHRSGEDHPEDRPDEDPAVDRHGSHGDGRG